MVNDMRLTEQEMRNLKTWFVEQSCKEENENLETELEEVEDALANLITKLK